MIPENGNKQIFRKYLQHVFTKRTNGGTIRRG